LRGAIAYHGNPAIRAAQGQADGVTIGAMSAGRVAMARGPLTVLMLFAMATNDLCLATVTYREPFDYTRWRGDQWQDAAIVRASPQHEDEQCIVLDAVHDAVLVAEPH
jgi:hypothetical protein